MSKTRVYQVWPQSEDAYPFDGTFLTREEAEERLAEHHGARLMESDLDEDEYAQLCVEEMESQSRQRQQQGTWAGQEETKRRTAVWEEYKRRWTDCSTRPEPPKRK